MRRWRILKSLGVLLPVVALFASPFFEPVKQRVLNRSDLRLFTTQDRERRVQTIELHNGGGAQLSKVFVGLNIQPEIENPIADFYFAPSDTAPFRSLMETLSHSDCWTELPAPEKDKLTAVTDDHSSNRTLFDLDRAFNGFLDAKLESKPDFVTGLRELRSGQQSYDDWHNSWKKRCEYRPRDSVCPQVESAVQSWEYTKRNVQTRALKVWRESTGVELIPPTRQLSPNGLVYFTFSLGPDESAFLKVRYGPNSMPFASPEVISNPARKITPVTSRQDLISSPLWIFIYYYPLLSGFWVCLIVFCLSLAWPLLRPASLLPTYKVFNLALQTNDPGHWELTSQREKFPIFQEHRRLWTRFKGTPVEHSPEEIFEFIKSCAIEERDREYFRSQADLNRFVTKKLKQLIRLP